jgi:hypothetical protein
MDQSGTVANCWQHCQLDIKLNVPLFKCDNPII